MLLVEKVLMLKTTDLFKDTPEQSLVDIARIMQPLEILEGTTIFEKGDLGKSMYIIVSGKIRIHDKDHNLAVLNDHDFLGELSLLDEEPRSASASALTDCHLLQMDQEPFYEVIFRNPQVLKGILRTLSQRLRKMDERELKMSKQRDNPLPN